MRYTKNSQALDQRTLLNRVIRYIPRFIKSSQLANFVLECGSPLLKVLFGKKLIYANEEKIISNILRLKRAFHGTLSVLDLTKECLDFGAQISLKASSRELILYPLIRVIKPEVVVETGCAWGGSSVFLLGALKENGKGKLISIDLPAQEGVHGMDVTIPKDQVGALIPAQLRSCWVLIQADAKEHLSKVLLENEVELFIHDSLHTTTHQSFEYHTARALMKEGSVIASDDIRWNCAFNNFLETHKIEGFSPLGNRNFGICVNTFSDYEKQHS